MVGIRWRTTLVGERELWASDREQKWWAIADSAHCDLCVFVSDFMLILMIL